ncbi:uncharacterized protein [Typha latifolia]|uniref:uncharacterized protein isoform X1 n=1 Tax=Typha latifolia TaxID=4733 RepID=UPI003C306325
MQGGHHQHQLHHLHQQLASLISAALPQKLATTTSSASADSSSSSAAPEGPGERADDADRVSALESLHGTIVFPPNSHLLPQSAPFLAQGLSQLLSDKSYAVRRSAVLAYASLCAVLCSNSPSPPGIGLPDRLVSWAVPLLGDAGVASGSVELALDGLKEFLDVGDAGSTERFVPPILKACQELLEDERTSLGLLRQLLGLLTLISSKYGQCFQPHFVDIVDLLLGWAFVPNLSESDRCMIMDSFLLLQKHWLNSLQFSLGLLLKFLGDMEVLINDSSVEHGHSMDRLVALFSCFLTVLQVTASGVLEMDLLEQISRPVEDMAPRLLRCILMFCTKFGSSNWTQESWRCLVLLAEILREKFAKFYETAFTILFQSLTSVPSFQLQEVLKTNLQLLSLQNLGLLPSSVGAVLQFHSALSQLRLHPNHLVVASSAATYLFLLQHCSSDVVSQAIESLFEELELLKGMIGKHHVDCTNLGWVTLDITRNHQLKTDLGHDSGYPEHKLLSLVRFDLKVLLTSVSFVASKGLPDHITVDTLRYERATKLASFILGKLNPLEIPFQGCLELQFHIFRILHKLIDVELLSKHRILKTSSKGDDQKRESLETENVYYDKKVEYIKRYGALIFRALHISSPTTIRVEVLDWICTFGGLAISMEKDADMFTNCYEAYRDAIISSDVLFSILDSAYDRETKIRSHVASALEMLLQARLIDTRYYFSVSHVALDKLADPDTSIRNAFVRVISVVLPTTVYSCGLLEDVGSFSKSLHTSAAGKCYMNWQHMLAKKQLSRKLHSQQLVSILSYISHRSKLPLSSWIQRLVFSCRGKKDIFSSQQEVNADTGPDDISKDAKEDGAVLDKLCPVNNLAAVWWSIHEAARHCINLRLRTNLGGPTQTFAALERMLLDVPNVLALEAKQGESKYIGSSDVHLLPMRLLLDFVEALKKNVYNAYEGSFILPCPTKQSSLFFRANKKVCEEWFSRICEPMLNAGLALHCDYATLHYCGLRLLDFRNVLASSFKDKGRGGSVAENNLLRTRLECDVLKVLRHVSLALCRCHEIDALDGLQKWAMLTFNSLFKEDNQLSTGVPGSSGHLSWMTGLVYQAQGQYEKAAAHYCHLLQSEEALSSMGSDGIQFVITRVIECYTSLSDWSCLESWLTELQTLRATHAGKDYSGALTTAGNELNAIHALGCFDEGDFHSALGYLDLTPKSSCELTLDPKVALQRSEQMLLWSMLQNDGSSSVVHEELGKAKLMLEEALSVVPLDGFTEAAAYAAQLLCIFAFEDGTRYNDQHKVNYSPLFLGSLDQVLQSPINKIHQDCSLWIKVFRVYHTVQPSSSTTLLLCQKLLGLARKQGNFMLANRMYQYLINHGTICSQVMSREILGLNVQYEGILLKYAEGTHEEALTDLWSFVHSNILSTRTDGSETGTLLKAKACLKLSSWLEKESLNLTLSDIVLKICEDYNANAACDGFSYAKNRLLSSDGGLPSNISYHSVIQEIVGAAAKASCDLCPNMGKAWLSYASWCFSQAKNSLPMHGSVLQSCSLSPAPEKELSADRYLLTEDEISKVETIIKRICHSDKYALSMGDVSAANLEPSSYPFSENDALVNSLVQQAAYLMQATAGAPGFESCDGECPSAILSSQLQVLICENIATNKDDILPLVDELIHIWWPLRKRRVSMFGHAARGYFEYLSRSSVKLQASADCHILQGRTRSCILRAVLYLLHIILNYGVELRETLEVGLSTVPALPWQEIIPQLFARLSSHPEKAVRKQLEGLLMMLGKLSPYSIVYPTLVDINAYEGNPSEELQRMLDFLIRLHPKLVQDVTLAIDELGMITVLWEEQWLSTLQDLHSDVIRRINMLKEEIARVAMNSTLSLAEKSKINAAKYSAMMAPVIVALERRLASTSREPRTAHEIWFRKEYGEQLKSAILGLKTPPGSAAAIEDVWRPFNAVAASLATHHRKSFISLSEVAPQLALLSTSDIPIPGFEKQMSMFDSSGTSVSDIPGVVTVSSFHEQVTILSTKTKPKKLVLRGSDGQKYTYLLKGREDLRLDARIMQLLEALNSLLYSSNNAHGRSLAIRYYSVTPISGRAGLIQWVDNVTSIYSVYKAWQNRSQLAQLSAVGTGNMSNAVPPIPRPSDMFYGKIIPALKEKGIKRVISRRDWPLDVKRKVLLELMKETPRQLLWQEMWCSSEGFKSFSLKTKRFSGSVAAMSIVGHILGLGDRHLDNILMDFCSGDVVHIDYNICFDKGKRLKIPEIVPFRLTQTIETALGLTGTEGAFRANCEAVTSVLQKNKDIILMLLEVFVWDPLMEWTRGNSQDEATIAGEEKKGMELAVSLSLFSSRVQEIRVPLQEHHDLLVAILPGAESALKRFLDVLNQYEVISAIFYHADKERSSLLQHETSAKSIVAEATSITENCRASFELQAHELAQAKAVAAEEAQELAIWVDQHGRILDALRNGSIPAPQTCIGLSSMEALSLTSAVLVSGIPLTIVPEPTQAQCYDLDREISHLITELDNGLVSATETLSEYALALQRVLPVNYNTTNPVSGWAQVLQLSINSLSPDILSLAKRQAADLVAKAQGQGLDLIQLRHRDLSHKIESSIADIQRLDGECSELMNSIGSGTEAQSRERLLSAFMKYVQSSSYARNDDGLSISHPAQNKHDGIRKFRAHEDLEEKSTKVLSVLGMAVIELYKEVRTRVLEISTKPIETAGSRTGCSGLQADLGIGFKEFEEQIEKCVLIAGFVEEVQGVIGINLLSTSTDNEKSILGNWTSTFQTIMQSMTHLIEQMIEVVLPEIIRSIVSHNSEVMEAFGALSQIRGSIDTALENLVEVELERASLMELEHNYSVKVGLITDQQLALEEAAVKGRDHLSWEEAEELASQEEACRAQLDQLHQTWSQKDMRTSSLAKIEANVLNSLISAEQYLASLASIEHEGDLHIRRRSNTLVAILTKPFCMLESMDNWVSANGPNSSHSNLILADLVSSSSSLSELVWALGGLLKKHTFFIWKVGLVDSALDLCLHEVSSSVEHNFDFEQLYSSLKKKLAVHLQEQTVRYLKERVAPSFVLLLNEEIDNLKHVTEGRRELVSDQVNRDAGAVKRVQLMLGEYCNAHETARAARSAISLMKRQVNELTDTLGKTILEMVEVEWLHDLSSTHILNNKVLLQNIFADDKFFTLITNLNRSRILEKVKSSMSSIARSLECLQACERTSVSAEGQLERAMGWACAGPNTGATGNSSGKSSGIPSEFHDHLLRRRQLLWTAQERVSEMIKICTSVLEFEASREGLFWTPGDKPSGRSTGKGRGWQQAYLNSLTRLDTSYHSFTRAEHDWKLAQHNMEAAANGLFSATKQLHVASVKAKSASVDLQDILAAMSECACEASTALSAFSRVSRGHTALTSECGSMLDEVLAITEGLNDVYSLGKEAATVHSALMADLSKANMILLPLEASLKTDSASMSDAISKESESNTNISIAHGKALYQSYIFGLREACQTLASLVPSLTQSVKELHSMLTKLARLSSLHAGNLHKALEGLGESQEVRSHDLLSRSDLLHGAASLADKDKGPSMSREGSTQDIINAAEFSVQNEQWISPPEHTYTSSSGSCSDITEVSLSENTEKVEQILHLTKSGEDTSGTISLVYADGLETNYAEKSKSKVPRDDSSSSTATADLLFPSDNMPALSLSYKAKVTHVDSAHDVEEVRVEETKPLAGKREELLLKQIKGHAWSGDDLNPNSDSASRIMRGKNAFALSVLKQVEQKLHGRDIESIRSLKISEQVDYLLRQATDIDNLCNMYEGWTPWI